MRLARVTTLSSIILLVTFSIHAQTFEILSALRLAEPSTSIRSTAMAGAADPTSSEAACAATNPAAAAGVKRLTVTAAGSNLSYQTEVVRWTPQVLFSYHDTVHSTALSQAAFSIPAGRVVVNGYFLQQPRVESATPLVGVHDGTSYADPVCDPACGYLFAPFPGFDRSDRRFGTSVSFRSGNVDFGLGAELRKLDERTATGRYIFTAAPEPVNDRFLRTTSGSSVVPVMGIVWHASPSISLGATYKGGGTFDHTTSACSTAEIMDTNCQSSIVTLNETRQKMPASLSAGVSWQPVPALTLAASAVRRNYDTLAWEPYGLLSVPAILPYHNVTEAHGGVEYRHGSFALRAGWWRDPSHFDASHYATTDWADRIDHLTYGLSVTVAGTDFGVAVDDGGKHGASRVMLGATHSF